MHCVTARSCERPSCIWTIWTLLWAVQATVLATFLVSYNEIGSAGEKWDESEMVRG
ncbi:hypothetical protein LX36DRAFT_650506 [Colletotrichum falcatum]|nr:hypothetical protein LX36DRAFT_650506 [Colletotrichum falcatum]